MNPHKATIYVTTKGRFVGCDTSAGQVWFSLTDALYEEIESMLNQDKNVMERLAAQHPELYREVRLKHISHQPLIIFLRSEEDLTMMRYYLQCQTVCATQTWPLARVEESNRYHLR